MSTVKRAKRARRYSVGERVCANGRYVTVRSVTGPGYAPRYELSDGTSVYSSAIAGTD